MFNGRPREASGERVVRFAGRYLASDGRNKRLSGLHFVAALAVTFIVRHLGGRIWWSVVFWHAELSRLCKTTPWRVGWTQEGRRRGTLKRGRRQQAAGARPPCARQTRTQRAWGSRDGPVKNATDGERCVTQIDPEGSYPPAAHLATLR